MLLGIITIVDSIEIYFIFYWTFDTKQGLNIKIIIYNIININNIIYKKNYIIKI